MNRTSQEIYHALLSSGALGGGSALTNLDPDPDEASAVTLDYRTGEKVWVLASAPSVSRDTFLKLAEAAMDYALDHEGAITETGIVCQSITDNFHLAAKRLHIRVFEVKKVDKKSICGFCGSALTAPTKVKGWHGCPRCQRLLRDEAVVRLCPSCLAAFGACPPLEGRIRELLAIEGPGTLPDLSYCPSCRSPDRSRHVVIVDILAKAVVEKAITLDRLRELKVPNEILQLLHLRAQTRRVT